jgi:hypothetical protein
MDRDMILRAVVKDMVWRAVSWGADGVDGEDDDGWEASVTVGGIPYRIPYRVDWFGHEDFRVDYPDDRANTTHPALAAAKAAAEADYRTRIAEAINLNLIEGLVEALEDVRRHCQNSGIESATVGERVAERCEETALLALAAFRAAGGEVG